MVKGTNKTGYRIDYQSIDRAFSLQSVRLRIEVSLTATYSVTGGYFGGNYTRRMITRFLGDINSPENFHAQTRLGRCFRSAGRALNNIAFFHDRQFCHQSSFPLSTVKLLHSYADTFVRLSIFSFDSSTPRRRCAGQYAIVCRSFINRMQSGWITKGMQGHWLRVN